MCGRWVGGTEVNKRGPISNHGAAVAQAIAYQIVTRLCSRQAEEDRQSSILSTAAAQSRRYPFFSRSAALGCHFNTRLIFLRQWRWRIDLFLLPKMSRIWSTGLACCLRVRLFSVVGIRILAPAGSKNARAHRADYLYSASSPLNFIWAIFWTLGPKTGCWKVPVTVAGITISP